MNLYIKVEGREWKASGTELLATLGFARVPVEGFNPQQVQGITVWGVPLLGDKPLRGKRSAHRVLALCPVCDKVVSAGRLQQHSQVHRKCERCGSVKPLGQSCSCFDNGSQ